MTNKENKQAEKERDNLLNYYPRHAVPWERCEDGLVNLITPKFKNRIVKKYVVPKLRHPNMKIKLDEFGSYTWQLINGQTSINQIGQKLQGQFGEKIEPVYERLGLFITLLARRQYIYLNKSGTEQNNSRQPKAHPPGKKIGGNS